MINKDSGLDRWGVIIWGMVLIEKVMLMSI